MNQVNPFILMTLGVWLISAIACFATKDIGPLILAFIFTVLSGFGYYLYISE
jgi:hypothetical protein